MAIAGGDPRFSWVGRLGGRPGGLATIKGRDTKDNIARGNFAGFPGGYQGNAFDVNTPDRFGMPILTFIDTRAWAGVQAEELGQGEAIAYNLREMFLA
jgi:acetyl-CoA carboxylase carboxyl transferase subunit alpha